jgi:hypothetical protein
MGQLIGTRDEGRQGDIHLFLLKNLQKNSQCQRMRLLEHKWSYERRNLKTSAHTPFVSRTSEYLRMIDREACPEPAESILSLERMLILSSLTY